MKNYPTLIFTLLVAFLLHLTGQAQVSPIAAQEGAQLKFLSSGEIATFSKDTVLFSNRKFTLAQCPSWLDGQTFWRGTIDAVDFRVEADGHIVILTPQPIRGADSQAAELEAKGFTLVDPEVFQLFETHAANRVLAYTKAVKAGERYSLRKYSIVLGFKDVNAKVVLKGIGAGLEFDSAGDVDILQAGTVLFSNRKFTLEQCPSWLKGLTFWRGPIDAVDFRVKTDGNLIILTPHPIKGADSQATALEAQGFTLVVPDAFQLFGTHTANRVLAYTKAVKAGERYTFDKYSIVVGFSEPGHVMQSEGASIVVQGKGAVGTFDKGTVVFTDRQFTLAELPAQLKGMPYWQGSIDGLTFRVEKGGRLLMLTPQKVTSATTQIQALESEGFRLVDSDAFQLFGEHPANRVLVYAKRVRAGEWYKFGKYTVPLGFSEAAQLEEKPWSENSGELLYNGIQLPEEWPPRSISPVSTDPLPVPYLDHRPEIVSIDVGRQLFVDDFLVEKTNLKRVYHHPVKYAGNPVLKPETPIEINEVRVAPQGEGMAGNAAAVTKSGGIWWDPQDKIFRMWYEAGWLGTVAMVTSVDGIHWDRPDLDIRPGTNQVLPLDLTADSWTVVPNWGSDDPEARYTMFFRGPGGFESSLSLTSPDGIHWNRRTKAGVCGDRSTHFYNPFRKKWVYSIRVWPNGLTARSRDYYECDDFMAEAEWSDADRVFWMRTDNLDVNDYESGDKPQLYNFDAVAYESLMLGMFEIHQGPQNDKADELGLPKITELQFAYSRDGFHWDRPVRDIAIKAERKDVWDRGYVQPVGSICVIQGDELWFYYSAFQGDPSRAKQHFFNTGYYANGATGLAVLRRDGFASMEAQGEAATLLTRPVVFTGKRLFVNVNAPRGALRAEVRDLDGNPIEPYTLANSVPFTGDSTLAELSWENAGDLSALAGKPVRLHFELTDGALYAFWVSQDGSGRSDGYLAGGGPGYTGPTDTVGRAALEDKQVREISEM